MKWDEWRGSLDGRPTMWIKRLLRIPLYRSRGRWRSIRLDLHKMVRPDDEGCYHTHPAWAIRLPLWGGYIEQKHTPGTTIKWCYWRRPLEISIVRPRFCHRVDSLLNGRVSYSLWLRGPIIADVELHGDGWPPEKRGAHPERN